MNPVVPPQNPKQAMLQALVGEMTENARKVEGVHAVLVVAMSLSGEMSASVNAPDISIDTLIACVTQMLGQLRAAKIAEAQAALLQDSHGPSPMGN